MLSHLYILTGMLIIQNAINCNLVRLKIYLILFLILSFYLFFERVLTKILNKFDFSFSFLNLKYFNYVIGRYRAKDLIIDQSYISMGIKGERDD